MDARGDRREKTIGIVSAILLGAGFVAMYFGLSWFWMVWVLGFAVLVPLLSILLGADDDAEAEVEASDDGGGSPDALETLRERYARGELTDEQFERKLERLLETETVEGLEDARRSGGASDPEGRPRREREREG